MYDTKTLLPDHIVIKFQKVYSATLILRSHRKKHKHFSIFLKKRLTDSTSSYSRTRSTFMEANIYDFSKAESTDLAKFFQERLM